MVPLGYLVAQTRGVMFARERDNVVFVRELCNLFDPSCICGTGVYSFLEVFRDQSRIYYKPIRDSARKSSEMQCIFCVLRNFAYNAIIT